MTQTTPPSDKPTTEDPGLETIDWANFQFPPRAGVRTTQELLSGVPAKATPTASAPTWAAPPRRVDTWHLDHERWILSHPGQRKKVELLKITTRRRLALVADLVVQQPNDRDQAGLWRGLDHAIHMAFGVGLGEMLAMGPDQWEWPFSMIQGGSRGQAGMGDTGRVTDDTTGGGEHKRMGLNGF